MRKNIKHLGASSKAKTFTVRLPENVSEMIRNRADKLDMSYSYYVGAVCTLEVNHSLLTQFSDPLADSKEELTADEAIALIKKLKQSGVDLKALLKGEPPVPAQKIIIPPDPDSREEKLTRPVPQMPKMKTIADLIRLNAQQNPANPDPEITAALAGGVGDVSRKMREAQLKEAQEERQERKMREKILENLADLPEEEAE